MNKKGFTLIELLAVIIILAIIALIAVPTILNIIASSKKKALEDTAYGMIRAGELYYAENSLIGNNIEKTFDGPNYTDLNFKGEKITNGSVTVTEDGEVSIWLYKDGYCVYKDASDNKVSTKEVQSIDECQKNTVKIICEKRFTAVPFDIGTEYTCDPGDGIKRQFYILEISEDNVSLIMNRNIGGTVAWCSKEDYILAGGTEAEYGTSGKSNKGPLTVTNYLNKVTKNWIDVRVSLPTYEQIYNVNGSKTLTNKRWIWGNLGCKVNECTELIENDVARTGTTYGYWTSSADINNSTNSWDLRNAGILESYPIGSSFVRGSGVRPVITIPKSKIS